VINGHVFDSQSGRYQVGLYQVEDFTIRPNKNNLFCYLAKYE